MYQLISTGDNGGFEIQSKKLQKIKKYLIETQTKNEIQILNNDKPMNMTTLFKPSTIIELLRKSIAHQINQPVNKFILEFEKGDFFVFIGPEKWRYEKSAAFTSMVTSVMKAKLKQGQTLVKCSLDYQSKDIIVMTATINEHGKEDTFKIKL